MKRIQYHRYGGSEGSRLEVVEPLPPGSGAVLLHVAAASSAHPDISGCCTTEAKLFTGLRLPRKLAIPGSIAAARALPSRSAIGRRASLIDAYSALIKLEADHQPNGRLNIAPAAGLS